jgi:hypothetical protein
MAGDGQAPARIQPRQTLELTLGECWKLLREASFGRVVFTMHALPAIRPVNHFIDGHAIIIRSHLGSAITGQASGDGAVVCYEADDIDPNRHTGWSVVATGMARLHRVCGPDPDRPPEGGRDGRGGRRQRPGRRDVGQLAKIFGARAVGIAGGPQKVAYLRGIGFDEAIHHRAGDLADQLAAATPDGIDVYFENVGGHVWPAVEPPSPASRCAGSSRCTTNPDCRPARTARPRSWRRSWSRA